MHVVLHVAVWRRSYRAQAELRKTEVKTLKTLPFAERLERSLRFWMVSSVIPNKILLRLNTNTFSGIHYYWQTTDELVSWLPPSHPKAVITKSAAALRKELEALLPEMEEAEENNMSIYIEGMNIELPIPEVIIAQFCLQP